MTIIDDYLKDQIHFTNKYGERTIVLMQIGHFFECYGVDNMEETTNSENLYRLSDILDIQLTRKNKNIKENSRKNPLMIGVNIYSIDKYIQILLNNNYTSILIEQTSEAPFVERKVTNIYSPGTNVQYNLRGQTNNLMCVYIESNKSIHSAHSTSENMCIGISIIDLSTGKSIVYELYSNEKDKNYGLDEIFRFIQTYDPKEIFFIKKNLKHSNEFLSNYLDLSHRVVHFKDEIKKEYYDLNYQRTLLDKIFKNTGLLSVVEYLDLENRHFGLLSYICVLDFAYEHNSTIIEKISKPDVWESEKYLTLTNNTINQLNLVEHQGQVSTNKFNSLYAVVNNASTSIGKRLLRERLLNPILDTNELNKRYDYVESMINSNSPAYYKNYETHLMKIQDIERLHRKMGLKMLQPCDFAGLEFSYEHIKNILGIENDSISSLMPSHKSITEFNSFIEEYNRDFNMDEIVKYHLDKISNSFFKENVYKEIDEVQTKIVNCHFIYETIISKLSNYLEDSTKSKKFLKLDNNDRDGYFLSITSKRSESLKRNLKKENYPVIDIKFTNKTISFTTNDIETKTATKPNVKIVNSYLKELSNKLVNLEQQLQEMCKDKFLERLEYYDIKYSSVLKEITNYVSNIDLIKSIAKTSLNYGYVRPKIVESENSFIDAKELRHPIIERINNNTNYVTNDVKLGIDITGILLFGTNASGKSSLMKAVGLNIIMAQAGFFVPAKEFNYSPYEYLFTRINNNDNIFKGESSFAVEMGELRSILKRANNKSLVLGDELCSGTENISALSIFSSSVIKLDERRTNFVFATHLHDLCKIPQISNLETIKMFHLKVIFNEETGELIYDRKLEEGNGPTIYGLEVCRAMDMDMEFLKLSEQIRKQILGESETLLNPKKSHFNAQVFVHDCSICQQKAEDVHHIKFQCTADENKIIDSHIVKDCKSNLVPLCKKCHNDVHSGHININGWIQTSNGIILDYGNITKDELIEKKTRNRKLSEDQIDIIVNLKNENPKITGGQARIYLEKTHSIKISSSTYSKVIKGTY